MNTLGGGKRHKKVKLILDIDKVSARLGALLEESRGIKPPFPAAILLPAASTFRSLCWMQHVIRLTTDVVATATMANDDIVADGGGEGHALRWLQR
mmetsp:Transcript_25938/g.36237  ORF Transcript_25938/g.36237 Transcript_25938/m.36237 type:complete len:96 (-) Transcript_25938:609-896(-)